MALESQTLQRPLVPQERQRIAFVTAVASLEPSVVMVGRLDVAATTISSLCNSCNYPMSVGRCTNIYMYVCVRKRKLRTQLLPCFMLTQ